jgi:hypothetical protein
MSHLKTSRRKNGDTKQVPHWGPTKTVEPGYNDIGSHDTRL